MGALDAILQADALFMMGDFGELITYLPCPNGIPQSPLNGSVVVDRPGQQDRFGVVLQHIEINIPRIFAGVTLDPRVGEDKVFVADRQGRPPVAHVVNKILSQDTGMFRIQLH